MKRLFLAVLLTLGLVAWPIQAQQTKTWFYVTTAIDSSGLESAFSGEVSATISGNHGTVDLSWNAVTTNTLGLPDTISGYNVYRTAVSGSGYVKLNTSLITVLTYSDTSAFPSAPKMNPPTVP